MSNEDEEGAGQSQTDSETVPETVPDTPDPPASDHDAHVEVRKGNLDRTTNKPHDK